MHNASYGKKAAGTSLFAFVLAAALFTTVALAQAGNDPSGKVKGSGHGYGSEKTVTVCHVPPGNPSAAHTITVGESALKAHLGHGDSEGACQ